MVGLPGHPQPEALGVWLLPQEGLQTVQDPRGIVCIVDVHPGTLKNQVTTYIDLFVVQVIC